MSAPHPHKTNAARLLDSLGIHYELRAYVVDLEDLTAISVARKIGMPVEQVFKTLVTRTSDNTHLFAVIPGDSELDLKKLAAVAGVRKAELAPLKEVEPLTGYLRGAVTVLSAKKPFPAFADETLELWDAISVSAGQRGLQLVLSPADYLRGTGAILADLTKVPSSRPPRMTYVRLVFAHLGKDLRLEWRNRDSINGMLFFALLVVVVFALAFDPTAYPTIARQISGGLLWVAVLFASITALNNAWARELNNGVLDAHRLAPAPASALFVGKALANFVFVSVVELALAPAFAVFYNLHPLGEAWMLLPILPLGTWALVSNGTFFAALSLRTRNRELLLPLVLCPIAMPALLASIQATTNVLTGEASPSLWIKVLLAYDIVFTTAAVLLFDPILHAE